MINLEHIVWKEGNYYVAQFLNVDVSSFGESKQDALNNLNEALDLYFEDSDRKNFQEIEQPEIIHTTFSYA